MELVSLYTEAKKEYLQQLSTWIVPPLVEFFRNEFNTIAEKDSRKAMSAFQTFCAEIPRWNQDVIDTNIGILLDNCRCDYVEELMTAVFIAHAKILTSIRVSTKQKKLQITLPKLDHFLHRVFVECARAFWKAPFLFALDLSPIEKQKNVLQAESMCTESLSGAVRSLLPVKSILRDYLEEEEDSGDKATTKVEEEEDEKAEEDATAAGGAVAETPAVVATAIPVIPAIPVEAPVVVATAIPVTPVIPVEAPAVVAPVIPAESKEKQTVVIEKLETPPKEPEPTISQHAVSGETKAPVVNLEKRHSPETVQTVRIDTEPTVHFTPYDTVYGMDGTDIRYTPKEDKLSSDWGMDDVPRLTIQDTSSSLNGVDMEDLEPTATAALPEDIDAPLGSTLDFEELS